MGLTDSIEWMVFKRTVLSVLARIETAVERRPTRIALELPTRTMKDGKLMSNYELPNDEVVTVTIKTTNRGYNTAIPNVNCHLGHEV
jgi:hypothetical protein